VHLLHINIDAKGVSKRCLDVILDVKQPGSIALHDRKNDAQISLPQTAEETSGQLAAPEAVPLPPATQDPHALHASASCHAPKQRQHLIHFGIT